MPGIVAGLLLVFIPLSGDYITASVLGGAKGNMVGRHGRQPVPVGPELGARLGHVGAADPDDPARASAWSAVIALLVGAHDRGASGASSSGEGGPPASPTTATAGAGGMSAVTTSTLGDRVDAPRRAAAPPRGGADFDVLTFGLGVCGRCSSTSSCSSRSCSSWPTRSPTPTLVPGLGRLHARGWYSRLWEQRAAEADAIKNSLVAAVGQHGHRRRARRLRRRGAGPARRRLGEAVPACWSSSSW